METNQGITTLYTSRADVLKVMRKAGLEVSNSHTTRIRGWHNWSRGISVDNLNPFRNRYQRDNRLHYWVSNEPYHTIRIDYTCGSGINATYKPEVARAELEKVEKALTDARIHFVRTTKDSIEVWVLNPYFGRDYKCLCGNKH